MGIATTPQTNSFQFIDNKYNLLSISMSQDYHHQAIFSFSNGFERSQQEQQQQQQQQQQHIAQQIRRDKLRVQGFDPPPPLVGIEDEESSALHVYEPAAGMLSEMFAFPSAAGGAGASTATELLENQILQSYRNNPYSHHRQGMVVGGGGDSAAAMQLFLMNPQHQRSPSPSSSNPPPQSTSSTLHMLLPNPNSSFGQFTWLPNGGSDNNPSEIPAVVEGQGLSLSLSSSLEAAKAEEMRMGDGGMMFFGGSTPPQYQFKSLGGGALHLQGGGLGASSSFGTVSMLRNSRYAKAAQELLEEFCSVGRGQFKKNKYHRPNNNNSNNDGIPSSNAAAGAASGGGGNSSKDIPSLSAADRLEHQRRKVKLLSMLDEVDRRYNHYCEQMQMVVNSFDMVMGFGAAVPYTCLAQKAMSRHFRCLKDAIAAQLKHSCELLGEKDAGTSGVTKGETPRLRILEQSLRQQRAFQQMGMMEQEAWRPQRGLPERSVNILRAWLFEHFLHPYPTDADKHLLARQTGLSRNQVSNWFINARVRLWKPMVEEMYQQEAKDDSANEQSSGSAQTPTPNAPPPTTTTTAINTTPPEFNAPENDPSFIPISTFPESAPAASSHSFPAMRDHQSDIGATLIRFGTNAGDVSLTLGLRHTGNMPEKSPFSVRDFGGC